MDEILVKRKRRPVHLNLLVIRLPLPGLVSFFHRVSGAMLFLMLPVLLWLFQTSLASPEGYADVKAMISHPLTKVFLLGLIWSYLHHFCAGLRFLLLDAGWGFDLPVARFTSKLVLFLSLSATVIAGGVLLW